MLSKIVKGIFESVGFEIKRYSVAHSQNARLNEILKGSNINLIYDIGANEGQFGKELRKLGYKGRIVSFEPLPDAYEILLKNSKNDTLWEIAPRTAIGDNDGEIEINIAGNSASSSVLPMHDTHIQAAPHTASVGKVKTPIKKIDSFFKDYIKEDSILFVKIDTQGYEDYVINGGLKTLVHAKVLQMELSLTEVYTGQKLILELIEKTLKMGFELWGLEPVFVDPNSGRMLQVDAIFKKIE